MNMIELLQDGDNPFLPKRNRTSLKAQVTEPGDPEFSRARAGTQEQVPSAAVQYRLLQNKRKAQKVIQFFNERGIDIPDAVNEAATTGFIEQEGFFTKFLEAIDAPRRVVNFAIQDIVGGREEARGFRSPDVADYFKVLFGREEEVALDTGLDASSGSQTLDLMGWEEADTIPGKIARGFADFALQVVTDPLSWFTFGGSALGKKVLARAAESTIDNAVAVALRGGGTDALSKSLRREFVAIKQRVREEMLEKLPKGADPIQIASQVNKRAEELLRMDLADRVLTPVATRDFAKIPKEWIPLLPKYATGGLRIATPLAALTGSQKMLTSGFTIPGTRGLARKLVTGHIRKMKDNAIKRFGAAERVSRVLDDIARKMDVEGPLVRALSKGDISGGEYMMIRNAFESFSLRRQVGEFTTRLQADQSEIFKIAKSELNEAFGDDVELLDQLNRGLTALIQSPSDVLRIGDRVISEDSPLYKRAIRFKRYARSVLNKTHEMMVRAMGPDGEKLGFLKDYMPLSLTQGSRQALELLAGTPAAIDETAVTLHGVEGLGNYIVAKLLDAAGGPSAVTGAIGTNVYLMQRDLGLSPVYKLYDVGDTFMIDGRKILEGVNASPAIGAFLQSLNEGVIDIKQLNDAIEPIVENLAEKFNVKLGPRGGRLFDENPFELINSYLHTMENTIQARNLITTLERNGLVLPAVVKPDIQKTLAKMELKLRNPKVREMVEQLEEARREKLNANEALRRAALDATPETKARYARAARTKLSRVDYRPGRAGIHEAIVLQRPYTWSNEDIEALFDLGDKPIERFSRFLADVSNGKTSGIFEVSGRRLFESVDEAAEAGFLPLKHERSLVSALKKNKAMLVETKREGGEKVLEVTAGFTRFTNPIIDTRTFVSRRALEVAQLLGADKVRFRDVVDGLYAEVDVADVVRFMDDDEAIEFVARNLPQRFAKGVLDDEKSLALVVDDVAKMVRSRQRKTFDPKSPAKRKLWKIEGDELDPNIESFLYAPGVEPIVLRHGDDETEAIVSFLKERGFQFNKNNLVKDQNNNWRDPVSFFYAMADEGKWGVVRLGDDTVYFQGNIVVDGPLKAFKRQTLSDLEWLARFSGRTQLRVGDLVMDGLLDIPDVSNMTSEEIFEAVMQAFKASTTDEEALALARAYNVKPDDVKSLVVRQFKELFGKDFIMQVTGESKELVDVAFAAEEFLMLFNRLAKMARNAEGELGPLTQFVPSDEKAFKELFKRIRRHAKTLGIDPDIFRIEKSGLRVATPKIIEAGRRAFVRPSLQNVGGKALAGKLVQKDVLDFMENLVTNMSSVYTPIGIATIKQQTNYFVRLWKSMATVTRPGFHIRNLIGGVWNNAIIGVGVGDYARVRNGAMKVRAALRKGATLNEALRSIPDPDTRKIFRAAWDSGLLDLSFSTAEFRALSKANRDEIARKFGLFNPLNPDDFALVRGGAFFMESIEDFLRVSAFAAWYDPKNPASAKLAKEMALAVHFDYKNLTELETSIKRFVPFFVWSRRNIPLQLQVMLERPDLIQRYRHIMQAVEEQRSNVKQDDFPLSPYSGAMAVGTSVVFNPDTPFWARIILDPDIPINDVAEILEGDSPASIMANMVDFFMNNINPAIGSIADFWKTADYSDVNAPAPLNVVMKQVARTGLFDVSADGDVQVPYMMRTLYYLAFPWAREYENMLAPSDPNAQQALGLAEGERDIVKQTLMQLGKGLGIKTQTPSQGLSPAYKTSKELNKIIAQAIKMGHFNKEDWENFELSER